MNYIIAKYSLKSNYAQYFTHISHNFFEICTRTVGNCALNAFGTGTLIQKLALTFKKAKEEVYVKNIQGKKEVTDMYHQMNAWDNDAKAVFQNMPTKNQALIQKR